MQIHAFCQIKKTEQKSGHKITQNSLRSDFDKVTNMKRKEISDPLAME